MAEPDAVVGAMYAEDRVAQELQIAVERVAVGEATVAMTVSREMLNGLGVCHGGVLFTLADTAMAYASNANGQRTLSTSASIEWLAPAVVGDRLSATSRLVTARGKRAIHDISVCNSAGVTVAVVRGETLTTGPELPVGGIER